MHVSKIPANANVRTSYVIYKVKDLDDKDEILKARVGPHEKKDK